LQCAGVCPIWCCRLTGKPFWDIYLHNDPPLWRAYIDAVKFFGFDGWFIYGYLDLKADWKIDVSSQIVERSEDRIIRRIVYKTPEGELWEEIAYFRDRPPAPVVRRIKDLKEDLPKQKYFYPQILDYDDTLYKQMCKELGELGIMGLSCGLPGFTTWVDLVEGGIETLSYAWYDEPELLYEGAITLQSPTIFRELALPTLKKITRMARQAGVITLLHSCGKERELVRICAEETELDCINPLEVPPMGDCDLAEIKAKYGSRLALMGNIHTTEVMLKGTPQDVERACKKALEDAMEGGGFILSTGDQCGRDTPFV